ncbi:MAG: hypothetical protein N2037_12515 [Acidimicrobiales bacterium]|nr:hypothetical protein [Acidimicrobiales bacterium]
MTDGDHLPSSRSPNQFIIVDADTLAGWRRIDSSLAQLRSAVADLRRQVPDSLVAVIGDPSLKWALPEREREQMDEDIVNGRIVLAPAGTAGGHVTFIARAVDKARQKGLAPIVITDRAVPGAPLGKVRYDGTQWLFDLETKKTVDRPGPSRPARRRSRQQ